jgi:SPP1 family phage portal protein
MNLIHESFLRWIHQQKYHERLSNYSIYDAYYNGDHTVDIPPKVKAALTSELGTVSNYCRVVVDSAVEYTISNELGIEVKHDGTNQTEADKAERLLYDVYESNGLLFEEMLKAVTLMGKKGDVFLKLYVENDEIKIRILRPEICFPRYRSDDYKEMIYCAIQWFDEDLGSPSARNDGKKWKAQVFRPDVVEYYELADSSSIIDPFQSFTFRSATEEQIQRSEWKLMDVQDNILGFIPIIHIKNTLDDLEFGVSDLQVMTDLQDALNKILTDMLLTMDNQAFQRIVMFGAQTPKGQNISMEPGSIIEVPNENGSLQVVNAADITPFIQAMDRIVDQICTVTSIPKTVFSKSEGGAVSGYALRLHYLPLEHKCRRKEIILKNRLCELNKMIFKTAKLLGLDDYTNFRTKMQFNGGLPIDEVAQTQVHEMELRNKIKSRRKIMEERGIEDIEAEMAQINVESQDDFVSLSNRKAEA